MDNIHICFFPKHSWLAFTEQYLFPFLLLYDVAFAFAFSFQQSSYSRVFLVIQPVNIFLLNGIFDGPFYFIFLFVLFSGPLFCLACLTLDYLNIFNILFKLSTLSSNISLHYFYYMLLEEITYYFHEDIEDWQPCKSLLPFL